MKIKVLELKEIVKVINKIMSSDFPVVVSFRLSKMIKPINDILKMVTEKEEQLYKKYGETNKDKINVKPENFDIFNKEFYEFVNEEVDINVDKINIKDIEKVELKPIEIELIKDFLIIEGETI
jgi:hypothetical protein